MAEVIPVEAVEAAMAAAVDHYAEASPNLSAVLDGNVELFRIALEAAAPHMLAEERLELVKLAKEFDGAEGGTLAYTTILDGRHAMRKNAHDQLMYILDSHLPNHAGANHDH